MSGFLIGLFFHSSSCCSAYLFICFFPPEPTLPHFLFIINTNSRLWDDFSLFHTHFADDFLPTCCRYGTLRNIKDTRWHNQKQPSQAEFRARQGGIKRRNKPAHRVKGISVSNERPFALPAYSFYPRIMPPATRARCSFLLRTRALRPSLRLYRPLCGLITSNTYGS